MFGLLYKEIALNKKNLLYIVLGEFLVSSLALFPIIFKDSFDALELVATLLSTVAFFIMFLILGLMTSGIYETDEIKKWAYFISSTPLTEAGHIQAKYLFTFLLYIVLMVWCWFLAAFLTAMGRSVDLMIPYEMFWIMLLGNAIEFPFIVRFGSKFGSYVKTAIITMLTLVAFEFLLFGDTSVFASPESIYNFLVGLSDSSYMSDIIIIIMAALPYVSAALYLLSCKISCKVYLKGAEEYV